MQPCLVTFLKIQQLIASSKRWMAWLKVVTLMFHNCYADSKYVLLDKILMQKRIIPRDTFKVLKWKSSMQDKNGPNIEHVLKT